MHRIRSLNIPRLIFGDKLTAHQPCESQLSMPEVLIRKARFEDRYALARITIDATDSAFRGRVPEPCLKGLTVQQSAANWGRSILEENVGEHLLVAEVEAVDVVGLVLARCFIRDIADADIVERYAHEINSLQIDPAWQRRGLGERLINEAARLTSTSERQGLIVRVLKDNPNITFYQTLGAEIVGSQPYVWEGYITAEIILAWKAIENIRNRHT